MDHAIQLKYMNLLSFFLEARTLDRLQRRSRPARDASSGHRRSARTNLAQSLPHGATGPQSIGQ